MSREPNLLIEDILESGAVIQEYTKNLDTASFAADTLVMDAVIRRFEIIGEAVKGLPEEWKLRESSVPWKEVAGFRDVLAHAYFDIDPSVVWNSATVHLPNLMDACVRLKHES